MIRVIVESPYAGDFDRNVEYAKEACRDCVKRGEVPFASHLFFTQFLDDKNPEERKIGIELGYDFWEKSDIVVFYMDLGLSAGMKAALCRAWEEGKAIDRRWLKPRTQARGAIVTGQDERLQAIARVIAEPQKEKKPRKQEQCLCPDFDLRGKTYEIWPDSMHSSNRCLVDPAKNEVVDTDHGFDPPLTNDELLSIYDYGKGY